MNSMNYNISNISRTLEEMQEKEKKKEQRKKIQEQLKIKKILQEQEDYLQFYDDLYDAIDEFFMIYNDVEIAYYYAIIEKDQIIRANFNERKQEAFQLYNEILEEIKARKLEEIEAKKQIELLTNYNNVKTKQNIKKGCKFIFEIFRDGLAMLIIIFIGLLCMDTGKTKRKKWIY